MKGQPKRSWYLLYVVPTVAKNWIALGEMLLDTNLVDNGYLDIIKINIPGNAVNCCREMFAQWLETDKDASWKQIITALQSSGVQLNTLAEQIKMKLQKGKCN